VKAEFGTFKPADFAGAFAALNDDQYGARIDVVQDLRLLFNEETLKKLGREMVRDCPAMPLAAWPDVASGIQQQAERA
jgi:hypothetical protein